MNTNKETGFNCPTIGNRIPKDMEPIRKSNGRWEFVKTGGKHGTDRSNQSQNRGSGGKK